MSDKHRNAGLVLLALGDARDQRTLASLVRELEPNIDEAEARGALVSLRKRGMVASLDGGQGYVLWWLTKEGVYVRDLLDAAA
jgi:hypothetical protein